MALKPSERQLFAVWDHSDKEAGVKVWDQSHFLFGKLLDTEMKAADEDDGCDLFHAPDERGKTLKVIAAEKSIGTGGGKCFECASIKFVDRRAPLDDALVDSVPCLDDLLIEVEYDDLKESLLQSDGRRQKGDEDEEKPHKKNGKAPAKNKEEPEDEEEEEEDAPKFKKGDIVLYRGEEVEVTKVAGGYYYLEDQDGGDFKTNDTSKLTRVEVREGDEEKEEDDEDVRPARGKGKAVANPPDEDEDDDWDDEDEEEEADEDDSELDDEEDDEVAAKKPAKKEDKAPKGKAKADVKKEEPKGKGKAKK
jgi:hypothetical protein